ncbi:Vacuolar protein sorting-associated protein 51 [Podila humilis]|nr:Vacuolar protein sorting-associated protein 51 [Podila humilis]
MSSPPTAAIRPLEPQPAPSSAVERTGTGPATRRRAKSFLRNYYGIQQAKTTATSVTKDNNSSNQAGPVSKSDPYDLDSHGFEVDKYMHKIFVEKQLPGLVQTDNELVADIRQLDGDMKTLVYENYSKFLSATDTINKMKTNVDNLESEMSRLTQNIDKIATSSSAIHSSLGGKREKIRQLNGVHSLLTKLQFVFELPTNLYQCLETESYTQAVMSYCRTLHLLQHYKHLTVFTGIERECKTIMVQIAQKIRQKMCSEKATITEISECVGLLLALKEDPVALWKQYLDLSVNCLSTGNARTLEEMKHLPLYVAPASSSPKSSQGISPATPKRTPKNITKQQKQQQQQQQQQQAVATGSGNLKDAKSRPAITPPEDKITFLNHHYFQQVETFVVSFKSYFLPLNPLSPLSVGDSKVAKEGVEEKTPLWSGKEARVQAVLHPTQVTEAAAAIKEAIFRIISGYLDTIGSFLDFPDDVFNIQPKVHVHVLQNLYLATLSSPGLCQMVGFDVLATKLTKNWETKLIDCSLAKTKVELMERIMDAKINSIPTTASSRPSLDVNYSHQQHLTAASPRPSSSSSRTTTSIPATTSSSSSSNASSPSSAELSMLINGTIQWLLNVIKTETIPFLETCMGSDAQFLETQEGRSQFLKIFQNGFKQFWDQILHEMKQAALSTGSSLRAALIMSYLSFEMSRSVVEHLYKTLSKTIFRVGKRNRSGSFLIESYEEPPVIPQLQWDCKAVIKDCEESGHALLDGFIAKAGNELAWLVMEVQSDDVNCMAMESPPPPSRISTAWEETYKKLNEIERLVIMVYGDEGERANREVSSESTRRESAFKGLGGGGGGGVGVGGSGGGERASSSGNDNGHGSRVSYRNDSMTSSSFGSNTMNSHNRFFENQQRNMLLNNIDKLFSDRVEIFIPCLDLTRTGIMFGIIKILLKGWAESVRLRTFSRCGFQQVQVDAEFGKVWLWRFATADERLMYSLLEETQQTAYRRCIDPVPLESGVVEAIASLGQA